MWVTTAKRFHALTQPISHHPPHGSEMLENSNKRNNNQQQQSSGSNNSTNNQPINNNNVAATIARVPNLFTAIPCCRSKTGGRGTTKN
jgi:hypothetical protein